MPPLSPEHTESILRRLDFLSVEVSDIPSFQRMTHAEYTQNRDRRRSLERLAENVVNATVDISKIILSSMKLPVPDTYRESVIQLGACGAIETTLAEKLSEMVRLRNILAHQYLDTRWPALRRFIDQGPALIEDFVSAIRKALPGS